MPLQFRKGVEADRSSITPDSGEPIYVTDTKKLYIGDGTTAGGVLVSGDAGVDSAATIALIDSAYVQARQDKAYSSLTGAPTTVSTFTNDAGYTTYDSANFTGQLTAASGVSFDPAGTDNSTDVALAGSYDYLTISGQEITLNQVDASTDISNLTTSNVTEGTNLYYTTARHDSDAGAYLTANSYATQSYVDGAVAALPDSAQVATIVTSYGYSTYDSANFSGQLTAASGVSFDPVGTDNSTDVTLAGSYDYLTLSGQQITLDQVDASTDISNLTTSNVTEGTNLYYTTARADSDAKAAISVTDAGGDGSLTYSSGTITYTGPSAAETRAHFSDGTGVTITSGSIAIGQSVGTSDSVTFAAVTTTGNIVVGGNLQVNGTTTTVSSTDLSVTDNMIYMNAGESSGSPTASIDVGWAANVNDDGSYAHVGLFRDATDNTFKVFEGYTPEPDAAVQINTGHASFSLAPFAARTLTGKYLGIDSDLTAASGTKFDPVGTDNSTDVTLAGSYNYLTLSGQQITLAQIDASTDISGLATVATTGAYSDLSGTPTNVSTFTNDAGYTTYDSGNTTGIVTNTFIRGLIDDSSVIVDGNGSTGGVTIQDGGIEVRTGTSSVAYVDLYCEVNNAHRARIKSAPHSSYSGNVDLTLPVSTGTIAITSDIPVAGTDVLAYDANLQSFVTTFTLPTSDGTTNQVLVTNGSGTLSFADQSGGLDSAAIIALVDSAYVQLRQTSTGGTDPIFKTISVSGQSDIVADATTDTLTIAAGSGISLTTDAGTDTLTITATGGGGGLDSAAVLALTGLSTSGITLYEYTATASQTLFSGADDNSATLSYTAGNILVHRNGILLVSTVDYTATNGTSLLLQAAADSGDTISITAYAPTLVNATQNTITSTVQEADSGQTSFTISHTEDQILVFLNGILLKDSDDYTSNGSTIVLTSAADSGDQLTVHNFAKYAASSSSGFNASKTYAYSILFGG